VENVQKELDVKRWGMLADMQSDMDATVKQIQKDRN
jgi:hypothetical protein